MVSSFPWIATGAHWRQISKLGVVLPKSNLELKTDVSVDNIVGDEHLISLNPPLEITKAQGLNGEDEVRRVLTRAVDNKTRLG